MSDDDNVISFGEAKLKKTSKGFCLHNNLTYDTMNRIVDCADCKHPIDGFEAFMVLVHQHSRAHQKLNYELKKAKELTKARIYTEAARNLGKAWSGKQIMAVDCPHCKKGLLPEDFTPIRSAMCLEWEMARRKKEKK